jgi:hypothetical protein
MVKGVARSGGASTSSTGSTGAQPSSQPLPTMQTGQNPHDPLTQLNSHLGYGAMAGINPFTDMGLNPNDPNMVRISRAFNWLIILLMRFLAAFLCIASDDDELASVPAANVFDARRPCHDGPTYLHGPAYGGYGAADS